MKAICSTLFVHLAQFYYRIFPTLSRRFPAPKAYVKAFVAGSIMFMTLCSCNSSRDHSESMEVGDYTGEQERLDIYAPFELTTDLSALTPSQKKMLPILIEAAKVMDTLLWYQAFGAPEPFLNAIDSDKVKNFARINYGPWDRLADNRPFLSAFGPKPASARFYPEDMTKEEFEAADLPDKRNLYTLLRRDGDGNLITIPYHEEYRPYLERASGYLKQAAAIAENPSLKRYLELRAEALLTDQFTESDEAWLDLTDNTIDIIIGPIENYEDHLYNYKTAYEAYILIKDKEWSQRLDKYVSYLIELQESLPVPDAYKAEAPGTDAQLNAYDAVYYAGDCNSGSKTIAVNLPNDETLQKEKGTRRSQLKNAMQAKFELILEPIADVLIDPEQRHHITFEAFFSNTMFHEVAHGLGIKNTINGKGTVREALQEESSWLEEGKADILGLYMVDYLYGKGVITEGDLEDYYTTFLASIFRSVRFGASSAHGKANMLRFNYFLEQEAFIRNEENGTYRVDMEKMREAVASLSRLILELQGNGDKEGVSRLGRESGRIGAQLQADLDRLTEKGIPVDIVFKQGMEVM